MIDKNDIPENEKMAILEMLKLMEPELNELNILVKEMAQIKSPFQNEFNHLKMMVNMNKLNSSDSKFVDKALILIKELNGFAVLLDKISEEPDEQLLYVKSGLLEKCENVRDRLVAKMS